MMGQTRAAIRMGGLDGVVVLDPDLAQLQLL